MNLAIVIPYFKISFFEETLASLSNQTSKDFNLYIGNDASPEDPSTLLKKYESQLDFTYKRFDKNLGGNSLSGQWDRCIAMTKDERWIMILGDDDYLTPEYVEKFYEHISRIESLKINVIRFASRIVQGTQISNLHSFPELEKSTDSFYKRYLVGGYRSSLSEHIFTREAYEEKGFRDLPLAWGSDMIAWLEFTCGGNIFTINSANAFIRISGDSLSRSGYQKDLKNLSRFLQFDLVIRQYLLLFRKNQKLPLLLFYEQKARGLGKASNYKFYLQMLIKLLFQKELMAALKFTKRFLYYKFRS